MPKRFPADFELKTSISESHVLMECEDGASREIAPQKVTFATLKSWLLGFFPTKLPNPNKLTFTGGVTGDYDGSADESVPIPTALPNPQPLVLDGVEYNGASKLTYNSPTSLPNPKALSFTGGDTGDYDGSAAKSVHIPVIPASLPNPAPVTFTGAGGGVAYDGSSAREVYIPPPTRPGQPTGMALSYPASVSVRNGALQRIAARLLPAFNMQDCAIFLPASGEAIALYPDGTFRVRQLGVSRVYVVPTLAASAYRAVDVTVRPAYLRRTGGGGLRLAAGAALIF